MKTNQIPDNNAVIIKDYNCPLTDFMHTEGKRAVFLSFQGQHH